MEDMDSEVKRRYWILEVDTDIDIVLALGVADQIECRRHGDSERGLCAGA